MKNQIKDGHFGLHAHGKPTIEHQIELFPAERIINAARSALWDAWQIGLQKSGNTVYPRLPLLDKEPMEPEI